MKAYKIITKNGEEEQIEIFPLDDNDEIKIEIGDKYCRDGSVTLTLDEVQELISVLQAFVL